MKNLFLFLLFFTATIAKLQANSDSDNLNKPYVTAKIYGQLGNNLFQVATACSLAWDNNAEPYFPELNSSWPISRHVFFRCRNILPSNHAPVSFGWDEILDGIYRPIPYQPNMVINGYFQSEKYFVHNRQRILDLFAPLPSDLEYMQSKYDWLINHPNTVGIQLRYQKYGLDTEGILYPQYGIDFLSKAMSYFPEDTLFVVTSDNLNYTRKNMPSWAKNVVYLENEPHYICMYLMSMCKHNIISNSSFGWWGAWLNQNPDKIVIRPKTWLIGYYLPDICPEDWIEIDAKYLRLKEVKD